MTRDRYKSLLPGVAACLVLISSVAVAKSPKLPAGDGSQRYIVMLEGAPLAEHMAAQHRAGALASSRAIGAPGRAPAFKLNARSAASQAYLADLDQRFDEARAELEISLGRELDVVHRYRYALHGFATSLSADEAKQLSKTPGVVSITPDLKQKMHTDAGPQWIGADDIWNGLGFIPERRGEGVIVGVIDSGINWDHPSFADPGENGAFGQHDHVNPLGEQLGLCDQPGVECNDKLIGVYDFVEDNEETEVVEESNSGRDNTNHGTHVASIAVGNPQSVSLLGSPRAISGVAPNANLISYRTCYQGDPDDFEDDACQSSAFLAAIDQAIADGVDVVNYSAGLSVTISPWSWPQDIAMLNARDAGIVVVASSGNEGESSAAVGNPAAAPWVVAVGSASHSRWIGGLLNATSGGNTPPPGEILGDTDTEDNLANREIVHASDYGFPLCGTGETQGVPDCGGVQSDSNPFEPGTFNGEIVVCDRGEYARVEKGFNVMLAGAGGYVLANTAAEGEQIIPDDHCLPSLHIGVKDGDALRTWLASGSGHTASLTGLSVLDRDEAGDRLSSFSSHGPMPSPVEDIMKPNLIAPGSLIVGASGEDNGFYVFSGTSMSSPHVAGAAALLLSLDPDLTPSMVGSLIETTATDAQAVDENRDPATRNQVGAGRPQLGEAALAGLYLDETRENFLSASPNQGGQPRELNLPSMMNANCGSVCTFTRTVKPLINGRTWTATAEGFPPGVVASVTPQQFTLNSGGSQALEVSVDLSGANAIGQWVFGQVRLSANNLPEQVLPVSLFSSAGALPTGVTITTDADGGHETLTLGGLVALPQATFTGGGLVRPTETTEGLREDVTWQDPYDSLDGIMVVLEEVPEGALWLHASTPPSPAEDIDLFVGRDLNGDGLPQANEEVCFSADFFDIEQCDILAPEPGSWWIVVQNFEDGANSGSPVQDITVETAVIVPGGNLSATGPGITAGNENFGVRLAWDNVNAVAGETLLGAVGVGGAAGTPYGVGVIPVTFKRNGIGAAQTLALMDGRPSSFALAAGEAHEFAFIDVPEGVNSLTVSAEGDSNSQSNNLVLELRRRGFGSAFNEAPFVAAASSAGAVAGSDSGGSGVGPSVTLSGGSLQPGRWYAVVRNTGGQAASVTVQADLASAGDPVPMYAGLWEPISRFGIGQGFEYNVAGNARAVIWYSYDEAGLPVWYLAAAPSVDGNVWTADLLRFSNDGKDQFSRKVGQISMTYLGELDLVFSWTLFGASGSDRMVPISPQTCMDSDSYLGLWYRGVDGLGGASVELNAQNQSQIHYLYDAKGIPRWLLGASTSDDDEFDFLQFSGFCPVCAETGVNFTTVGTIGRTFTGEGNGSWTLDYAFDAPIMGGANRTDSIVKITDRVDCR